MISPEVAITKKRKSYWGENGRENEDNFNDPAVGMIQWWLKQLQFFEGWSYRPDIDCVKKSYYHSQRLELLNFLLF